MPVSQFQKRKHWNTCLQTLSVVKTKIPPYQVVPAHPPCSMVAMCGLLGTNAHPLERSLLGTKNHNLYQIPKYNMFANSQRCENYNTTIKYQLTCLVQWLRVGWCLCWGKDSIWFSLNQGNESIVRRRVMDGKKITGFFDTNIYRTNILMRIHGILWS